MDILLVDDDEDIRASYRRLLERAGYSVATAENGLEALSVIQRQPVGVVLCDIRLGILEGPRLYQEIRAARPELATRVVFITGAPDTPEARVLARATGRPVLSKPVHAADLLAAVQGAGEGLPGF